MPALRLFVRAGPFLLAAAAAVIWLRRRRLARQAMPVPPPPPMPPMPPMPPRAEPERAAAPSHEPVDIVAVVDDLLAAGRA